MRQPIIQTLLRYPFRLPAETIAERVLGTESPSLKQSFEVFEVLLAMTREGLVKRHTKDGQGLFMLNLERPTAHAPLQLVNMLVVCAAGAPLYTIVDAAAFGETSTDDKTLKRWQGVDCHPVKRVVILTTHYFSDIFSTDAWYPWSAELLPDITTKLESFSITEEYFLKEPEHVH